MKSSQTILIFALIVLTICLRWIPNFPNFSPYLAIALFGGALLQNKNYSILGVTAILYLSDLALNNTVSRQYFPDYEGFVWFAPYMIVNLIATVSIILFGSTILRKLSLQNIALGSIGAAVIFFLISNFGVWVSGEVAYPKTFGGLMQCYMQGLPFIKGTLAGTLFYSAILFGTYALAKTYALKPQVA